MATAKSQTKKRSTKKQSIEPRLAQEPVFIPEVPEFDQVNTAPTTRKRNWKLFLGLALLLVAFLLWFNRSLFVVAMVNGQPIFRWDFNRVLEDRFGAQTLEGLISEKLITTEAQKAGVSVQKSELDAKISEIVASVGQNVSLDELLSFQGLTRSDFENQVTLQLTVEKILGKDVVIQESDIDNFIATNRAMLRSTDAAALREEAKRAILDKSISEKLQEWFTNLRKAAVIEKYSK